MKSGNKNSTNDNQLLVSLYTRDIAGLKKFYIETLGFKVPSNATEDNILYLESKPVLQLESSATLPEIVSLRIALPSRRELAKVIGRLCTVNHSNIRMDVADRQLTRLRDPDGNHIEFFVLKEVNDKTTEKPLDIEALFNELLPDDRLCDKLPASAKVIIEEG